MKRIYTYLLFVIGCLAIPSIYIKADDIYSRFQYGFYGNIILTKDNADFRSLPGYPNCCPNFENGEGKGLELGILAEYPLFQYFFVGSRLGFESYNSILRAESTFPFQDINNVSVGLLEYVIETKFSNIFAEIIFGIRPVDGLLLGAGIRAAYPLSSTFSQKEVLKFPSDYGTFENGKRERNVITDEKLPDAVKPIFSIRLGLSYEFILNAKGSIRLAPELSYVFPLSSVIENYDWHSSSLRAGAALKFSKPEEKPLLADINSEGLLEIRRFNSCENNYVKFIPENLEFIPYVEAPAGLTNWKFTLFRGDKIISQYEGTDDLPKKMYLPLMKDSALFVNLDGEYNYSLYVKDSQDKEVTVEKSFIAAEKEYSLATDIDAYGIDVKDGRRYTKKRIELLRKISTNVRPLLNYVFFDTKSSEIPERYNNISRLKTYEYDFKDMHSLNALEIYHDLLNIIGKRMRENPETSINLTGCISNIPEEQSTPELLNNRVNSIREYLNSVWEIDTSRVVILKNNNPKGLPSRYSTPGFENHIIESAEENQRVEITTSPENDFLLEPVITTDTLNQVFPLNFVFNPAVKSSGQNYSWALNISQNGKRFAKFQGENKVPEALNLSLKDREAEMIDKGGNLYYDFAVIDEFGQKCNKKGQIDVELMKLDSSFYKYSLILFEYQSFNIESKNKQIIDLVQKAMTDDANIQICGYTDFLGDSVTNSLLAKNRALFAAKKIMGNENINTDEGVEINDYNSPVIIKDRNAENIVFNPFIKNVRYTVIGKGEEEPLLYDNSTPEGRFYSRTVTVSLVNEKNEKK